MTGNRVEGTGSGEPEDGRISYEVLDFADLNGAAAEHYKRKRRRRLLAFITLPGLVLGTATIATAYGTGLIGQPDVVACTATSAPAPERESFEIELLNSNDTDGLAGEVSTTLEERGFDIASVGNADSSVYIKDVAVIYHGPDGLDNALLLQKQIPGAKLWNDNRTDGSVRLVLGYGYDGMTDEPEPPPPAPSEITLNVYNTTYQEGLAKEVGDELEEREFTVADVGNDPQGSFLDGDVAVIRYGPEGEKAAQRLAQQVDGVTLQKSDTRSGVRLDLVLGTEFQGLKAETEVPEVKPYVRPAETIERPCEQQ